MSNYDSQELPRPCEVASPFDTFEASTSASHSIRVEQLYAGPVDCVAGAPVSTEPPISETPISETLIDAPIPCDQDAVTEPLPVVESETKPDMQVVSEPQATPDTAVIATPLAPVATTLETSVMTAPDAPVVPTAETPVVATPVDTAPAPVVPTAETPVVTTPDTPVVTTIEAPVNTTPDTPVVTTIETPVNTTSDTPVVTTPVTTTPVTATPETPVAATPVAPVITAPEKPPGIQFSDLPLRAEVQQAVQAAGYETPTSIQAEIIPHMLDGRDVVAQSQTGTGKTAAFALPILSRVDVRRHLPQVLVLTPTRELAIQVAKSFSTYAGNLPGFAVMAIYGGQDYGIQFKQLKRGVQVVVGTPGRVIDHIKRGTLDLSGIACLVLDEADEMLNMGFLDDVKFVLDQAPDTRQIALFSATLPAPIRTIAQRYLNDPARITVQKKTMTAESIRQRALFLAPRDKISTLKRLLEVEETDGVIIFTNTKDASVSVAEQLNREGLAAVALNGDMPQKVRERTIEQLKAGHLDILVATDVAARGLDVTRVSHVFNFDVPQDNDSYIHRIGRTGRAGRKGEAFIFLTPSQRGKLRFIEKATRQPIEIVEPPTADAINAMRARRFTQRITDTAGEQDLAMFQKLITDFAEESGTPMATIAAALAQIGQRGRPFLVQDRPRPKPSTKPSTTNTGRQSSGAPGQHSGNGNGNANGGGGKRKFPTLGPPEAGKKRYWLAVGWRDGVKPGNIVGAIANEGGLRGEDIGPIRIHDSYSTVDLPAGLSDEVSETLRRTRVAGKPSNLSTTGPDADEAAGRPAHASSKDRYSKQPQNGKSGYAGKRKHKPQSQPRG